MVCWLLPCAISIHPSFSALIFLIGLQCHLFILLYNGNLESPEKLLYLSARLCSLGDNTLPCDRLCLRALFKVYAGSVVIVIGVQHIGSRSTHVWWIQHCTFQLILLLFEMLFIRCLYMKEQ
jgi:hypothetical protein